MPAAGGGTQTTGSRQIPAMLQTLADAGGPALQAYVRQTYYPGGHVSSAAFQPAALNDVMTRAQAQGVDTGKLFQNDYSGLKILAAIVAAGFGGAALISALSTAGPAGAAAMDAAGLGTTVPAGTAIAPSVDIGADALTGGLTSSIPTAATLADLGTPAGTAVPDVGAGATVPAAGTGAATSGGADAAGGNLAADQSLGTTGTFDSAGNWVPGASGVNPASFGGSPGIFSRFLNTLVSPAGLGTLINAGAQLYGANKISAANQAAVAAQLKAAEEALALQGQQYNTNVAQNTAQANQKTEAYNQGLALNAPYRALGVNALNFLGQGLPGYTPQAVPQAAPIAPLGTPSPISVPGQNIPAPTFSPGATVGERRYINGQLAEWDGQGWKAV